MSISRYFVSFALLASISVGLAFFNPNVRLQGAQLENRIRLTPVLASRKEYFTEEVFVLDDSLPPTLEPDSQIRALKFISFVTNYRTRVEEASKKKKLPEKTLEHLQLLTEKSEELQKLVLRANLRLVHSIALQHQGMGVEMNDLLFEGFRGLRKAMSKFDVKKGTAFSTYAFPWIKDHVRGALAGAPPITLPRHVHKLLIKVKAIQNNLYAQYGRTATDEELRVAMGISPDQFDIVRRAMALAARQSEHTEPEEAARGTKILFDESTWEMEPLEGLSGNGVTEVASSEQLDPIDAFEQNDVQFAILSALCTLPAEEASVIYHKLGLSQLSSDLVTRAVKEDRRDIKTLVERLKTPEKGWLESLTPKEVAAIYYKGLRRLRRRINHLDSSKYPHIRLLTENVAE